MSEQQYMTNFTGEDMKISIAEDSKKSADINEEEGTVTVATGADPDAQARVVQESNEVPEGTSKEVLDWVGNDKERAQAALDKEQANEKPRSGLTEDLQKLLDEDDDK